MSDSLDQLLGEETLDFRPSSGSFDLDAVASRIAATGFSFQDEADPSMFVICADQQARDTFRARRLADPAGGFPYTLLIQATPDLVSVDPMPDDTLLPLARDFVQWLASRYRCRVTNDMGTDLTALLPAE